MQIQEPTPPAETTVQTNQEPTPPAETTMQTNQEPETVRQSWRNIVTPWQKATVAVLPIFLITRLIFLLLTYFVGVLFFVPNYSPRALSWRAVLYTWYHWDVVRFATIASKGYVSLDYAAFFPLYPAMESVVSKFLHIDIIISGMIISNVAFFGVLIVLYRFVEMEFNSEIARRTALYLSIFPSALFFFAAYNESLFLLFLLLCFYTLRRGLWWLAGLFGCLATLTRSIGVLLLVIFCCEFFRQVFPQLRQSWRDKRMLHSLRLLAGLPAVLLIPLSMGIYAYGLWIRFGDPLAFSHAQKYWRVGPSFPWVAPLIAIKSVVRLSPFIFAIPHDIIDLTALGLFLVLLGLTFFGPERFRKDQWTFALFGLMALVYAVLFPGIPTPGVPYDPMPSMQRFVLEIFAGFIMLARLGRRSWFHEWYLLLSLPMLTFLVIQFLTGHWTV